MLMKMQQLNLPDYLARSSGFTQNFTSIFIVILMQRKELSRRMHVAW